LTEKPNVNLILNHYQPEESYKTRIAAQIAEPQLRFESARKAITLLQTFPGGTMINISMNSKGSIDNNSLSSINTITYDVLHAQNIHSLNNRKRNPAILPQAPANATTTSAPSSAAPPRNATTANPPSPPRNTTAANPPSPPRNAAVQQSTPARRPVPPLLHSIQKGQKAALEKGTPLRTLKVCLGWNTTNPQCDLDVSAFLLGANGKVPGDSWFVFYGQNESPDHSTIFCADEPLDRESITIHLEKLNPSISRIVFVLTINEALEKKLHFGMMTDTYIRILNADNAQELVSFRMTEYYANVISMMIGEVYRHNGMWKFNAIGNGVAKDLSGLCSLYGVEVSD